MKKKLRAPVLFTIVMLFSLMVPFQNCADIGGDLPVDDSGLASVNGCGEEGFAYLHENYFIPHCGSCHGSGGIAPPPFADPNVTSSYFWAKSVSAESMLETSLENIFCGPVCNIEEGSHLHRILVEWLNDPSSCPE